MLDVEKLERQIKEATYFVPKCFECANVTAEHNSIEDTLETAIGNLRVYADRISTFSAKEEALKKRIKGNLNGEFPLADGTELQKGADTYGKATELIVNLSRSTFLNGKENSKKKYEATKDIYQSHFYAEYPCSEIGLTSPFFKDLSVTVLFYSDIHSLEFNRNYLLNKIKDNELLLSLYDSSYKGYNTNKPDYYEQLKQMSDEEAKIMLNDNIEITHLVLTSTTSTNTAIQIKGNFNNNWFILPIEFLDFNAGNIEKADKLFKEFKETHSNVNELEQAEACLNWYKSLVYSCLQLQ